LSDRSNQSVAELFRSGDRWFFRQDFSGPWTRRWADWTRLEFVESG